MTTPSRREGIPAATRGDHCRREVEQIPPLSTGCPVRSGDATLFEAVIWRKRPHVTLPILVLIVGAAAPPGPLQGCRWWLDADVQRELSVADNQVAAIEAEYSRTLTRRRLIRRKFEAARAELARALTRDDLTDAASERLVNRVEDLRRQRNAARTRLLVALYFLLTPEQRAKFPSLVEGGMIKTPPRC